MIIIDSKTQAQNIFILGNYLSRTCMYLAPLFRIFLSKNVFQLKIVKIKRHMKKAVKHLIICFNNSFELFKLIYSGEASPTMLCKYISVFTGGENNQFLQK